MVMLNFNDWKRAMEPVGRAREITARMRARAPVGREARP
jgi:hypothetical protein